MKHASALICLSVVFMSACYSPRYFVEKGDYDKAIYHYSTNLQRAGKARHKDLQGLETAYNLAQGRDQNLLDQLLAENKVETWPNINAIHRKIQARQEKLATIQNKYGGMQMLRYLPAIDSLQADSRHRAASYIYANAQRLLAITDSTGQRQPARDAYYALRDLKDHYFRFWENANQLIDSAYMLGKTHVIMRPSVQKDISDGDTFWGSIALEKNFVPNEWLVFYTDTLARNGFDYRADCRLNSLYVSSENSEQIVRTETKEVEDGYAEKRDSNGHVISRTVKYKTETTTITTYRSSRSAHGTLLLELFDEHTGQRVLSQSMEGFWNFDESSEISAPSSPTYWGMIWRVADELESQLKFSLKKALAPK